MLQKGAALSLQCGRDRDAPSITMVAIFVQTVADIRWWKPITKCREVILYCRCPQRAKLWSAEREVHRGKYTDYIHLGVIEWRQGVCEHEKMGKKAILFVMNRRHPPIATMCRIPRWHLSRFERRCTRHSHQKQRRNSESTVSKIKEELDELRKQASSIDGLG